MSLVNDMLRDLETRRASPAERAPLDGLRPVDEGASSRRGRQRLWLGLLALLGVTLLAALLLARPWLGMASVAPPAPAPVAEHTAAPLEPAVALPEPVAEPPGAPPLRLLASLPQHSRERFVLQLLLDGAPEYRRSEQSGVVSLRLPNLQLGEQGPRSGGFSAAGRSLSWSLQPVAGAGDGAVELLLVGLGDELQVFDRLEPAGERWQLWIEVPLVARGEDDFDLAQLPVAGAAPGVAQDYPAAPAAAPRAPSAVVVPPAADVPPAAPSAPAVEPVAALPRSPQLRVASHQPDALSEARQALLAGDGARAMALLEDLNRSQPDNREALRWLARAWLAAGQAERLLAELPAQLQRFPGDGELRVLLARAQLQAGDSAAAVATLAARLPPPGEDPAYHALLAASYQQTAQWQESARLYRNLVQLRPAQASWQLGLAIALEQLGARDAAAQHYRQALQGQGLDEDSRRYARERAAALGGDS